ncbi:GxxExxY protein [candidate division WOR-3 bacterium]|nr:GxxExxY protein [candidate division WOR-3 bacterium]
MEEKLLHKDLTHKIIGAAMEVHKRVGPGFSEKIYENGFIVELNLQGIPYEQQNRVTINYKGHNIGDYIIDTVVDKRIVVELKALDKINNIHEAQLISYLKASECKVGLIINFGKPSLEWKRILLKKELQSSD